MIYAFSSGLRGVVSWGEVRGKRRTNRLRKKEGRQLLGEKSSMGRGSGD